MDCHPISLDPPLQYGICMILCDWGEGTRLTCLCSSKHQDSLSQFFKPSSRFCYDCTIKDQCGHGLFVQTYQVSCELKKSALCLVWSTWGNYEVDAQCPVCFRDLHHWVVLNSMTLHWLAAAACCDLSVWRMFSVCLHEVAGFSLLQAVANVTYSKSYSQFKDIV